jgi:hypothetical protein
MFLIAHTSVERFFCKYTNLEIIDCEKSIVGLSNFYRDTDE